MKAFPVNFRAFLIVALAVGLAVGCAYLYMIGGIVGIVFGSALFVVLATLFVVFAVRVKIGKSRLRVAIAFGLGVALAVSAFTVAVVSYDKWEENEVSGYKYVSGRVCAVDTSSGAYRLNIEDLTVQGKCTDGILRLNIRAADNNIAELVSCGDRVSFSAYIRAYKLFGEGKVNGYAYRSDIRFAATVNSDDISIQFGEPGAMEGFMTGMRELLTQNMGERYGNLAFSMLTGDKHAFDSEIKSYFSVAGLGHVVAVSGLHIGFLTIVLNFVLCKLNRKVRYPIILAVLLAYTVVADFSPSVIRAVIMAVIVGASMLIRGRRDLLSSLCCAFSLILAVKPLYLFEAGFLMSFGAIFGIALFANSIGLFLKKHGAHNKVASAISAPVSVAIGVAPSNAYFVNSIQIMSMFVNMVLLPYISVVFIALVCILPIAAIPGCGPMLVICKYLLIPLDYVVYGISQVPYATVEIKSGAAVYLSYPIMFCASDFLIAKREKRIIALYSFIVILLLFTVLAV